MLGIYEVFWNEVKEKFGEVAEGLAVNFIFQNLLLIKFFTMKYNILWNFDIFKNFLSIVDIARF